LDEDKNLKGKSVFTVVTGSRKYFEFAFALARSYRLHNNIEDIPFFIVSDADFSLPSDLRWVQKKILPPGSIAKGVESKFALNELAPAYKSLYIDADSMVYRDISNAFDMPNDSINVIGTKITAGTWDDMPAQEVIVRFKIPYLVRYCGAFYFIIKNELSNSICAMVKDLAKSGYSFQKHAHGINEEPVFSISMATAGIEPIADTGNIWGDVHQLKSHHDLDVLKGRTHFTNSKANANYKFWIPEGDYSPAIIHFGGGNYNKNPWLFDAARLKIYYRLGVGKYIAGALTGLFVKSPYFLVKWFKNLRKPN